VNTGGFAQLVSFGPKSLNVIVPPAGAPSGPLITGLPGWLAVPFRFTRSDTGLPSCTSADAWVGTNGITGLTVKHSPNVASVAFGTPLVPDVNSPRQQYPPADVSCAELERIGKVVALLTGIGAPICVPPPVQAEKGLPSAVGPQRKNVRVPVQVDAPVMVRVVASSFTETEPVPIDRPPAGMLAPAASLGVVVSPDVQLPKRARMKSFRVAVVEVDERVSAPTVEKHSPERPISDRLMPAS